MSIPEPTQFNGDDPRDLSSGPGDPHQAFWRQWQFFKRHGLAESYLANYRSIPMFQEDVAKAERELLIEVDVMAGEHAQ